jgi:hypothetical protein
VKRLLLPAVLAAALLFPMAATTSAADHGDDGVLTLPFARSTCERLIARGVPFVTGAVGTGGGECFIIIIGGVPAP